MNNIDMKIFIPERARSGIGGGWSFTNNFKKALTNQVEFVDRKEDCDICFIPGCTMISRDDVRWCKDNKKKIVLRVDNIPRNSRNRNTGTSRLYDFAQMVDEVVYQSYWAKNWIEPFIKRKGIVIYNGIDTKIFNPQGEKMNTNSTFQFLYSRYNRDETKAWETVWYYFQKEFYKDNNIHLWIVGKFSPEQEEYNFDFFGGAEKRYKYYGIITDPEDMAKFYRGADYLLVPYQLEACSNVVIEAMMCGLGIKTFPGTCDSIKEIVNLNIQELTLETMGEKYLEIFKNVH